MPPKESGSDFLKAQALVATAEFESALPFIKKSLETKDHTYYASLLLSARVYDQTAQPELAILALQEYVKQPSGYSKELTARSLLLKNQIKVKIDPSKNFEKKLVERLANHSDKKIGLEELAWSLDFKCDQYCLEEISYFQEIQPLLLNWVDSKESSSAAAISIIKNRYSFFHSFLNSDSFNIQYKKSLALTLAQSLKKLRLLSEIDQPVRPQNNSKALALSLNPLLNDLEVWENK